MSLTLQLVSDLHLGITRIGLPKLATGVDVMVLAGDLDPYTKTNMRYLADAWGAAGSIIYVPGNHEYYGRDINDVRKRMADDCDDVGVTLLDGNATTIGGVRFVGATLWTDLALNARHRHDHGEVVRAIDMANRGLNDFRGWVKIGGKRFSPQDSIAIHKREKAFLADELAQAKRDGLPAVAVTHHAPSPSCIRPWWRGSPINPCFSSDLDDLIQAVEPRLWLHGHMHDSFNVKVGSTRIFCNPRGYGNDNRTGFDECLTLEV